MREYFKTTSIPPETKEFRDFCKKNGADFIEVEGNDVKSFWIIPKLYGEKRLAIVLKKSNGLTSVGTIQDDCQNFNKSGDGLFKEELAWIRKIFEKLEKWIPKQIDEVK